MQKRRVVILGSTGSIGTSALKVARDIPDRMEIVGLAAGTSVEALARQAREFNVRSVCIFNPSGADELARALPGVGRSAYTTGRGTGTYLRRLQKSIRTVRSVNPA